MFVFLTFIKVFSVLWFRVFVFLGITVPGFLGFRVHSAYRVSGSMNSGLGVRVQGLGFCKRVGVGLPGPVGLRCGVHGVEL